MACLFGVAVGLSIVTLDPDRWDDALLAAATAWIVLGLAAQTRDLARAYRHCGPLSPDARWGWHFAILWRVAIIGLLIANYALDSLQAGGQWHMPNSPDYSAFWGDPRSDVCDLCLLFVVCSITSTKRIPARRRLAPVWGALGVISAVVVCVIVLVNEGLVPALIHFGTAGIDMAEPAAFSEHTGAIYGSNRTMQFFWWCVGANVIVLVSVLLIRLLAVQWTRGARRRIILGGLVTICLGLTAGNTLWLILAGFRQVSPYLADNLSLAPAYRAIMVALLVILFVTAATWWWVQPSDWVRPNAVAPRGVEPRRYYHERWPVLLVLVAAVLGQHFGWLIPVQLLFGPTIKLPNMAFWEYVFDGDPYLPLAILWVVVGRMFAGWFGRRDDRRRPPPPLPRARFAAIWMSLAVLVLFGTPLLAALGFAFWIRPS